MEGLGERGGTVAVDNLTGFMGCVQPHQRIPELWRNDEMESFIARDFC
ncbi:hypothetical protein SALBM311S_05632 [Streptomyces alboniger]